jgi:hypothetical protein
MRIPIESICQNGLITIYKIIISMLIPVDLDKRIVHARLVMDLNKYMDESHRETKKRMSDSGMEFDWKEIKFDVVNYEKNGCLYRDDWSMIIDHEDYNGHDVFLKQIVTDRFRYVELKMQGVL